MAAKRKQRTRASRAPASAQERLLDTVHQIWLAGLGAVSKARSGAPQLLDDLVCEGARIHTQTRGAATKAMQGLLSGVQTSITERVSKVRGQATDALTGRARRQVPRVLEVLERLVSGSTVCESCRERAQFVDNLGVE